jgi:hypothetical protein
MTAVVRCGTLLGFLVFSVACSNGNLPTAPSPRPTQPPPTVGVPPLIGPADIYLFSATLPPYPVRPYTTASKYVLYDNGAFSLRYASPGGEYVGTYRQENGLISFRFVADDRWFATGTLNGDSLEVRYNAVMDLSDFESAVYRRSQ